MAALSPRFVATSNPVNGCQGDGWRDLNFLGEYESYFAEQPDYQILWSRLKIHLVHNGSEDRQEVYLSV